MYEGKPGQIHHWFSSHLGYPYDLAEDGTIPEWCLDLISVDFAKPEVAFFTLHEIVTHVMNRTLRNA